MEMGRLLGRNEATNSRSCLVRLPFWDIELVERFILGVQKNIDPSGIVFGQTCKFWIWFAPRTLFGLQGFIVGAVFQTFGPESVWFQ